MERIRPLDARKSFTIKYQKKNVRVWRVTRAVAHDIDGHLYLRRWEPNKEGKTPTQRKRKVWKRNELTYSRYPDGLVDIERALLQAISQGAESLIDIVELEALCKEIGGELIHVQSLDEPLASELRQEMTKMNERLAHVHTAELKEARDQLTYCVRFQDSRGRLNIGMLKCRLATVDERLIERIEAISNWTHVYEEDLLEIQRLRGDFYRFLSRLKASLARDQKAIRNFTRLSSRDRSFILGKLEVYIDNLIPWLHIRPFNRWAFHVLDDLQAIRNRIVFGYPRDCYMIYRRLENAIRAKEAQKQIFDLIELLTEIRSDLSNEVVHDVSEGTRLDFINGWQHLQDCLSTINDRGFVRPIADPLTPLMAEYGSTWSIEHDLFVGQGKVTGKHIDALKDLLKNMAKVF